MAISVVYNILLLLSLPALNLGLLSDYKICGDAECESPMSRVQAIRDYHGRDCRFLSFLKGDTIFVYHKLTGKREDLWAGTIDKQFGYFSKDAVQVEDVHTTTEKVVATQDSDFFCMDEFGYIIESHHLDGDDDVDEQSPNQELGTVVHADGSNIEGLSVPEATNSPMPVHEAEKVLTEDIQHAAKQDAEAKEGSQEAPPAPNVQGGSTSAPWLGSSVTGWFGLNSVEESDNLGEVEEKTEDKETADEASLASSVTGWLGWGEGKEAEDRVESKEQDLNTANSFTSSMTGWLGFEATTEQSVDKEQSEGEGDAIEEQEPAEKFRSRRMSLELESSQSEEEDKGEMGTLEWLGAGLTNQLSFGRTVQETVTPASEETDGENKEEKQQASWFQVGIGNILGYEKEADLGLESDFRDKNIEESQLEKTPEDPVSAVDKDRTSAESEDSNTQSPLGENASSLSGFFSVFNGLSPASSERKEEQNVLDNDKTKLNLQEDISSSEQHSVENTNRYSETIERDEGEEIKPRTGETDQIYLTQSDVDLPSDLNSVDFNIKSTEQLTAEGDKMEKLDEIHHRTDNISNEFSVVESHEDKENNFETDNSTTSQHADELAEGSQVNDPIQKTTEGVSEEPNSPAGQGGESGVDHLGFVTVTETEANQEESVDEGKMLHVEESTQGCEESHPAENKESDNVLEPDKGTSHTIESTTRPEDDAGQDPTRTEEQDTGGLQSILGFDNGTIKMKEHRETDEVHALDQLQVIEEDNQEGKDVNLREEKTLKELREGEAEGQQEHSEVATEVVEEMKIAQSQEEDRVVVEMHLEKNGETDEVEEKEEDKVGLKAEEEQGASEEVIEEEKQGEKMVVEEMLQQIDGLKQDKEKKLVELQEGDDTGIAKEEKEVQEPLKELKDEEDKDEKPLHTDNLIKGKDEELKGEEGIEEPRDKGQTRVISDETEAVTEPKKKDIQEEVTEATDVLNREEYRELKDDETHWELKEEENQQELREEENQQESEEGDETAVPGDMGVQNIVDGAQGQSQEEDILESASAQTDRIQSENRQRNTEEEAGNTNGDGVVSEKEEVADTLEGTRQEEDLTQGQRCHSELCSPAGNEHNTIESAEQKLLTAEDQILMENTEESVGMDAGEDRKTSEEQTNDIIETDEKTTSQGHLEDPGKVESSNSIAETDAEVLGSAVNTDVTGFSGGVNTPPDDNRLEQEDKNLSGNSGTFTREKTEHTHYDSTIKESENNDTVFDSATNGKSTDATGSSGSFAESQVAMQDHAGPQDAPASLVLSDGHGRDGAASQTGKAFGLFSNAFGFFRETESTLSSSNSDKSEGSKAEASQTPDREMEPLHDLPEGQSRIAEPQTHQPAIASRSSVEPDIPQPATPSAPQPQQSSASASTGNPLQSKTFSKDYRTLLVHVGEANLALLVELFGRHKLQFLDYILGVSEPAAEERDHDESILTDIETLLDYHMGALASPSARLAGSLQDEQKAGALKKLQDLLAKVRQSFNRGNPGDSDTNHQDKAEPGCVGQSCLSESKDEGITTEAESGPAGQGSAHLDVSSPIGSLRHVQDLVHQIAGDLTVHGRAVGELLVWLSTQV